MSLKPFGGIPRVPNPARRRLATSRKRVLRGSGVTPTAKRRQRASRPCDRAPRECPLRRPTYLSSRKATPRCRVAWHRGSAGVEEQGMRATGPPGTWEALSFPPKRPGRGPGTQSPGPRAACSPPSTGANSGAPRWYHQAKATKCGGMNDRESDPLIVPMKPGNSPERTRWREGEVGERSRWRARRRGHRAP